MTAPILVTGEHRAAWRGAGRGGGRARTGAGSGGSPGVRLRPPGSVADVFAASAPALVVNTAAYTAVDAAEDDADAAFRANRDGPAELARLCEAAGIPLIHISTDYVFDGLQGRALCRDRRHVAAGRLRREQACRRGRPCWRGARARSWCGRRGCIPRPARTSCAPCWPPGSATGRVAGRGGPDGMPDQRAGLGATPFWRWPPG